MQISATMNDGVGVVNVVDITVNGNQIYTTYVDASNILKVRTFFLSGNGTVIGTGATIVK